MADLYRTYAPPYKAYKHTLSPSYQAKNHFYAHLQHALWQQLSTIKIKT